MVGDEYPVVVMGHFDMPIGRVKLDPRVKGVMELHGDCYLSPSFLDTEDGLKLVSFTLSPIPSAED